LDVQEISASLKLGPDGVWYSDQSEYISYPADGNDACFEIEDRSFWFRHRNECIVAAIRAHPPKENGPIFDIGGGNGFVSQGLAASGFDVVLVEPGRSGALNAKRRGVNVVICATTETAGFKKSSLPAVGLFDVIEHVEDDYAFVSSMCELLKSGGRLYATVPAYSSLWSQEDVEAGHFRRYTLGNFCRLLEGAGFGIEFSTYFFRFLPLPIALFRALPYRVGISRSQNGSGSAVRQHVVRRGLTSRVLDVFLRSEVRNIAQSKSMRFGGSCLVVARKL